MSAQAEDDLVEAIFATYKRRRGGFNFPIAGALAKQLNSSLGHIDRADGYAFKVDAEIVRYFASASIEMWHRAIHSFVISIGLTRTSAVWSSVAGYYSSHYVLRAYAHLLGRFILFRRKRIIVLSTSKSGGFSCHVATKGAGDREHKTYWRNVRESARFGGDPFLTVATDDLIGSDSAHRNVANYLDHIGNFAAFAALSLDEVRKGIERISDLEVLSLPIPRVDKFPDLDNVQVIAYHRLVGFRAYLDNLLGSSNRFWSEHRTPPWCGGLVDFQIVEPDFASAAGAT